MRQVPNDISILLHPSDTEYCETLGDEVLTVESSPTASEQRLKEKEVIGSAISDNSC